MTHDTDSQTPSEERKPAAVDRPVVRDSEPATAPDGHQTGEATAQGRTPGVPHAASLPARESQSSQRDSIAWGSLDQRQFYEIHDADNVSDVSGLSGASILPTADPEVDRPVRKDSPAALPGKHNDDSRSGTQLSVDLDSLDRQLENYEFSQNDAAVQHQSPDTPPAAATERNQPDNSAQTNSSRVSSTSTEELRQLIEAKEREFNDNQLKLLQGKYKYNLPAYQKDFESFYDAHKFAMTKFTEHYLRGNNTDSSDAGLNSIAPQPAPNTRTDLPELTTRRQETGKPAASTGGRQSAVPPQTKDRPSGNNITPAAVQPAAATPDRPTAEQTVAQRQAERPGIEIAAAGAGAGANPAEPRNSQAGGQKRIAREPDDLFDDSEPGASPAPVQRHVRQRRATGEVRNPARQPDTDGWYTAGGSRAANQSRAEKTAPTSKPAPEAAEAPDRQIAQKQPERPRIAIAAAEAGAGANPAEPRNPQAGGQRRIAREPDDLFDDSQSSASPAPVQRRVRQRRAGSEVRNPPRQPDADGWYTAGGITAADRPRAENRVAKSKPAPEAAAPDRQIAQRQAERPWIPLAAVEARAGANPAEPRNLQASLPTRQVPKEIEVRRSPSRSDLTSDYPKTTSSSGSSTQDVTKQGFGPESRSGETTLRSSGGRSAASPWTQPLPNEIDAQRSPPRTGSVSDLSQTSSSSGSSTQSYFTPAPPAKRSRLDDRDRTSGNNR